MEIRNKLLEAFKDIDFVEETHSYYLNGKQLPSVSSLLKHFYEEFDSYNIGLRYAEKMGLRPEDVWKSWEGAAFIASDKGHRVHTFGENYTNWRYFGIGECPQVQCKQTLGIVQFWNNLPDHIVPVTFELQMYNEELGFSGTCDGLLLNLMTNQLILIDYKTNNELFGEYGEVPMKYIPVEKGITQNNYGKYVLQMGFYKLLLERAGFSVQSHTIIWLEEDRENKKLYKTFRTTPMSDWLYENKHIWSPVYNQK